MQSDKSIREGAFFIACFWGWIPMNNTDNKWYQFSDGWFTYYINPSTGEKKLNLDEGDVEVDGADYLDDFGEYFDGLDI